MKCLSKRKEILSKANKTDRFIANRPTVQKLFRKFRQKKKIQVGNLDLHKEMMNQEIK